jgi:hypothetical protein
MKNGSEGEVVKLDGCSKMVGQLLAELLWGVDIKSSFMLMMITVYFYLGLICRERGKDNICRALLVTHK